MKRSAVQLSEQLEWRIKTLRYLNLYSGSDEGEPEAEAIRDCMGMLILEIENILAQTDGENQHTGNEGPLGPLPDGILE